MNAFLFQNKTSMTVFSRYTP